MTILINHGANGQLVAQSGDLNLETGQIEKFKAVNPTRFLCRSEVREFLLDQAKKTRAHKYTRVSEQTLIELNEAVRQWCITRIAKLPSMGKTI